MSEKKYLTEKQLRARYGNVSPMTIWRWERDEQLEFPKPIYINGRKYRDLEQLEAFERKRASASGRGCLMEPKSTSQQATATAASSPKKANRQKVPKPNGQQADTHHNRRDLLNLHPEARSLSVYDGRRLCGYVIIPPSKAPNWAFDGQEQCLGAFPTEKEAVAAVVDAYDREVPRAADLAAFVDQPCQEALEPA